MKKLFGIIIFAAIIVFSFSACKNDLLDGSSWTGYFQGTKIFIRFNNPNFVISTGGHTLIEGTYSILDDTVSMTEAVNSAVFTGTLSGNILLLIMGNETISFTKRHRIFN